MGDPEGRWSRFFGKLAEGVVVGIIAGLIVAMLTPALLVRATREVAMATARLDYVLCPWPS